MKFTITGRELPAQGIRPMFGFEIHPPISNGNPNAEKTAADQLAELLPDKPTEGFTTGSEHTIEKAWVPRDNTLGTAVIVEGNFYRNTTAQAIAERIGMLINPANVHELEINITPHE